MSRICTALLHLLVGRCQNTHLFSSCWLYCLHVDYIQSFEMNLIFVVISIKTYVLCFIFAIHLYIMISCSLLVHSSVLCCNLSATEDEDHFFLTCPSYILDLWICINILKRVNWKQSVFIWIIAVYCFFLLFLSTIDYNI